MALNYTCNKGLKDLADYKWWETEDKQFKKMAVKYIWYLRLTVNCVHILVPMLHNQ